MDEAHWAAQMMEYLQEEDSQSHLDGVRPWHIWHYRAEVATLVDY